MEGAAGGAMARRNERREPQAPAAEVRDRGELPTQAADAHGLAPGDPGRVRSRSAPDRSAGPAARALEEELGS